MSLIAVNPHNNATVSASAGSGKTWLLITRIVRLLLAGAEPGNILALTFTRKAAGEMQMRLNQRLYEMATVSDDELVILLKQADCEINDTTIDRARRLYEKLLHNLYPVRLQTFHSFCQDILAKFPIEADIPPGFELIEDTGMLEQQAWQSLFVEATQIPDSNLTQQLEILMDVCNGAANTRTALTEFIRHRSDWWAYTNKQTDPIQFATDQLQETLQLSLPCDPLSDFFSAFDNIQFLLFANLLREHPTKTNLAHADTIDRVIKANDNNNDRFIQLRPVFLTAKNEPRARKDSATLRKKLGDKNAEQFLSLHQQICTGMQLAVDMMQRLRSLKLNHAWYSTGIRLLELFQRFKREQRLLDFTDLEWKTWQLLNQADNAEWIQYKIDQRIDHILIDEFQDTNPTQWHLLAPLLEEIAASDNERGRSVFLVGDEKQSIYSFRRANPRLQAQAADWLEKNLDSIAMPLDASRRSSQAVIDSVNRIFSQDSVSHIMPGFTEHQTWLKDLPGCVTLVELFRAADGNSDENENKPADSTFRNPLQQPLILEENDIHREEAKCIAREILALVNTPSFITRDGNVRAIEYGDIMILMRNRNHIETYETVLRELNIPFIGSRRGGLLDNIEIRDLIRLLEVLVTPFNNLALAQVLKSPVFSASDEDLMQLASLTHPEHEHSYWYQRLLVIGQNDDASEPIRRAALLLPLWRKLADTLPIHDCLDRIFVESNILQRYAASSDKKNRQRVVANCQRLLELSLENDAGRYPGISHFLQYLANAQNHSENPLDEPLVKNSESRVRVLTIHASKGLEAPVVFLADSNSQPANKSAYSCYVNWPAENHRPAHFMLQPGKSDTDSITAELQAKQNAARQREDLNLLYVALTRAREQLYISAVEDRKKQAGWYSFIQPAFENFGEADTMANGQTCRRHKHLSYTSADTAPASDSPATPHDMVTPHPGLKQVISTHPPVDVMIAPSKIEKDITVSLTAETEPENSTQNFDARIRGQIIHLSLELLCEIKPTKPGNTDLLFQLASTFSLPHDDPRLKDSIREAEAVYFNPEFATVFAHDLQAYNELPILFHQDGQRVYGLVDRVIKYEKQVVIIDYKSHRLSTVADPAEFAQSFLPQLACYRKGLEKIWPQCAFKTGILLTAINKIIWLPDS